MKNADKPAMPKKPIDATIPHEEWVNLFLKRGLTVSNTETINIHKAKAYCEANNIDRNEWVAGVIDKVAGGECHIEYRRYDGVKVTVDEQACVHHMLESTDMLHPISVALSNDVSVLRAEYIKAVTEVVGNLADEWEIGL